MRVHAVQTGTVAIRPNQVRGTGPGPARLLNTLVDSRWTEPLPIYAWVIEHPEGLIVVDSGETARVNEKGYFPGWNLYFRRNVREWIEPEEEIGPRMRALDLSPGDVRTVIMTHLHTDHAGGLAHFPQAEILVDRRAYEVATGRFGQLLGFLPRRWPDWFRPTLVDLPPRPLGPFPRSLDLTAEGDVTIVPTPGHTEGHLSVIVRGNDTTFFLAGDASYLKQTMVEQQVDGIGLSAATARLTLRRIAHFVAQQPTVYLPSHDPRSGARLRDRIATEPAVQVVTRGAIAIPTARAPGGGRGRPPHASGGPTSGSGRPPSASRWQGSAHPGA